jgi:hypothetical protein
MSSTSAAAVQPSGSLIREVSKKEEKKLREMREEKVDVECNGASHH